MTDERQDLKEATPDVSYLPFLQVAPFLLDEHDKVIGLIDIAAVIFYVIYNHLGSLNGCQCVTCYFCICKRLR